MTEQYLAQDCVDCGREFNYLSHKFDTCIYCQEEPKRVFCGDCLVPITDCNHGQEFNK
jgi:hypothetical protein